MDYIPLQQTNLVEMRLKDEVWLMKETAEGGRQLLNQPADEQRFVLWWKKKTNAMTYHLQSWEESW